MHVLALLLLPNLITEEVSSCAAGAIVEYLVNKYASDRLGPPKSDEALTVKYTYWLHFAEGSAMTPVLLDLLFTMTEKGAPFFIRPIARESLVASIHLTVSTIS